MNIKYTMTVFTVGFLFACTPGDIATDGGEETRGTSDGTGDTGDGDPSPQQWADIRCVDEGVGERCYGRLTDSEDAWSPLVLDCKLNELVDSGLAAPVDAWTAESCRAGEHPTTALPQWRCMTLFDRGTSVCYAGDGLWWTLVIPSCSIEPGQLAAWPDYQCNGTAGSIGTHPWDSVSCYGDPSSTCIGVQADDAMLVWPTCHVEQFTEVAAPGCVIDGPGGIGEECPCADGLVCIDGLCGPCIDGQLGCSCEGAATCDTGLTCVTADDGANVCAQPASTVPCEHNMRVDLDGVIHDDGCVAACTQGIDDCGPMTCSPAGSRPGGICAWPSDGQVWGPCPIDHASGQPTLCYGEDLACVPADFGESNICLPLGGCPESTPAYAIVYEAGWGDACYPRCDSDNDCADGMVCGRAVADGTSMCAWPRR